MKSRHLLMEVMSSPGSLQRAPPLTITTMSPMTTAEDPHRLRPGLETHIGFGVSILLAQGALPLVFLGPPGVEIRL